MNTQDKLLYESTEVWNQVLQTGQKNLAQAIIDFFPHEAVTVLDVGCGDGKLTNTIITATKRPIVGVDFSEEALSRCTFKTMQGDAASLPFKDQEFDLVLTTDMLEHLPYPIVERAWEQLFRVAKKWVMVAVPFREELLDATAKCHHCGCIYHVNWHMRSYDWPELISRCPASYEVDKIILTGEPWSPYHALETKFRRELLDEWSGWSKAVCPQCEGAGASPDAINPLPPLTASALGDIIYQEKSVEFDFRSHNEILIIYRHKNVGKASPPSVIKANTHFLKTNEIILSEAAIEGTLIPYPSVARVVRAIDGQGIILQFPAYAAYESLEIKTLDKEQCVFLSVEDGLGTLFHGQLHTDVNGQHVIPLPRKTASSYFGLLIRIQSTVFIKSIQFGTNYSVLSLLPQSASASYYEFKLNLIPAYLQVTSPCYFNQFNLSNVPAPQQNWLQLLQKMEQLVALNAEAYQVLNQDLTQMQNALQVQNQNLVQERDDLQALNQHFVQAQNALQVQNQNLVQERDDLQALNQNLAQVQNELLVRNQNLAQERDGLQELNHNLAQVQNELQVRTQNVVQELNHLQLENVQLLREIDAFKNMFTVRTLNKLHKLFRRIKRIFIK